MAQLPNLVLVTVDCLRADHVGWMGYPLPTTPFLDSLAPGSVTFDNAVVGGAPTFYSLPCLLASRGPLAFGRDVVGLAPGEANLASVLKQAGYHTAAFNAGNPYLSARFGYDQGFDRFEDFLHPDAPAQGLAEDRTPARMPWNERFGRFARRLGFGDLYDDLYFQYMVRLRNRGPVSFDLLRCFPAADILVDHAQQWLESSGSPFFLWLHLMDPHGPYYPAAEALRLMREDLDPDAARYVNHYWNRRELDAGRLRKHRNTIVRLYDAGIRWVDTQLARLIDHLEKAGLWGNCVFAFTADHGEEFLDHGSRFHSQWTGKEELLKVPLLLRFPYGSVTGRNSSVFSHIDLAPTLLEAIGVSVPVEFRGRSYWRHITSSEDWEQSAVVDCTEAINPNRSADRMKPRVLCVRDKQYKLIIRFGARGEELYDLAIDAAELRPLPPGAEPATRARLFRDAQKYLQRAPVGGSDLWLKAKLRDIRTELLSPVET